MTYRDDMEAENLKLKAQLLEAHSEIERLKPKPVLTPVIVVDAENSEKKLKSILHSPPSRVTYSSRSFLDHFRSPCIEIKIGIAIIVFMALTMALMIYVT